MFMRKFLLIQFVLFVAVSSSYASVLLVINDSSPDSVTIGNYYASARNITHICHIRTADTETISRGAFESEILKPVAFYLRSHSLQDDILYIVTTRGVPMIVDGDSVDSKLALVYQYLLTGNISYQVRIENPYFATGDNFRPFTRKDFDIYLVTRLISLDLVDQALVAESGGDFYFDLASPQQSTESDWVQQAAAILKKAGLKATVENTAKVLDNLEMVQGFLVQRAADAPLIKWKPGAIATMLDKNAGQSVWSYVKSGVTGFGSYVGDPLPDGYFRPQILFPAYISGRNLAEAFYASSRYLGARNVVIGDPLVSPYAKAPAAAPAAAIDKETGLPEIFSQRRMSWLMQKYSTSREAVLLLLKAEAAEGKGDRDAALSLVGQSLEQDPYIAESAELKSRLVPPEAASAPPAEKRVDAATPVKSAAEPAPSSSEPAPGPSVSVDFPARLISRTPIQFPFEAKVARVQGIVVVNLLIDEMGQVMKADIVSGDRRLAKSVLASVKLWRFEPELENGRAVTSRLTIPIKFKLTP
jgi:protein TonB